MSEVIVVTSGKGGVGKTTTSANVGTGLAMLGEKVILIDTDIGLRNLDVVMGLENRIAIIGLAKRIEEVFFPNDPMPYYLDRTGEPLKVIMHLRDEAHRFGITFHRNKRSAGFVRTQLEEIEGIGTKTADLLLRRFRSVARIRRASEEELADAVGTAKARRVYAYFHDGTPAPDRPGEDDGAGESPTANGASDA